MKQILLILFTIGLSACGVEDEGIVSNFKVNSINKDFCMEDKCVYTIKGNIDVGSFEFKADSETVGYIEKGQILKFKQNENGFIEEFIMN